MDGSNEAGEKHSGIPDYWDRAREAIREMHRQVGDLVLDDTGLAQRGLLVRHLVLPGNLAGTDKTLAFIAKEISPATYLNLMSQYRPCFHAAEYSGLDRRPTRAELREARDLARQLGLHRLD